VAKLNKAKELNAATQEEFENLHNTLKSQEIEIKNGKIEKIRGKLKTAAEF
jgi:hypothetical protein